MFDFALHSPCRDVGALPEVHDEGGCRLPSFHAHDDSEGSSCQS